MAPEQVWPLGQQATWLLDQAQMLSDGQQLCGAELLAQHNSYKRRSDGGEAY